MTLHTPYYSVNNWKAQIDDDTIILDPLRQGKGLFVVEGWNPTGEYCIYNQFFDSLQKAQAWILSLDQRTETMICDVGSARIFMCFDGSYWLSTPATVEHGQKPCYQQLPAVKNIKHAKRMVKKVLENLTHNDGGLKRSDLIHEQTYTSFTRLKKSKFMKSFSGLISGEFTTSGIDKRG